MTVLSAILLFFFVFFVICYFFHLFIGDDFNENLYKDVYRDYIDGDDHE